MLNYKDYINEMYIQSDVSKNISLIEFLHENEENSPKESRFWWIDSSGKFYPVSKQGHAQTGGEILQTKFGITVKRLSDVFPEMYKRGFARVGFIGLFGEYFLEVNYDSKQPLNHTQWKALKDLAIEIGADTIHDDTLRKRIWVNESKFLCENFYEHKDFFVYEGTNTITAVFEDNSRHSFKLYFRDHKKEDRQKFAAKAARTWKRLATEIRKNAGTNKVGNPIIIPWNECFQQALNHPDMTEFVNNMTSTPIFESSNSPKKSFLYEMTYDELLSSTANFQSLKDKKEGSKTAGKERIRKGQKEVNAKSLQVTSTVGPKDQEYETSLFSYKSMKKNINDPREVKTRWQGYIRFLERYDKGAKGDVQVNCNCPDYMFVWAKSNSDAGAGVTGQASTGEFSAKPMMQHQQNIFEIENSEESNQNSNVPEKEKTPEQTPFRKTFKGGGNSNNNTYGKNIRNPNRTPGLCKHLVALAKFLDTQGAVVAPATGNKEPSPVAPKGIKSPKPPVNIFESIRNFAINNPHFEVPYD